MLEQGVYGLIFYVSYGLFAAALTAVFQLWFRRFYHEDDLSKVAFEAASCLQFILWLPVAFARGPIPTWLYFSLPMAREIFDIFWIFFWKRAGFTDVYRNFIKGHHTFSTLTRSIGAFVFAQLLAPDDFNAVMKYSL